MYDISRLRVKLGVNNCIAHLCAEYKIQEFKKGQAKFERPKFYLRMF